MLSNSNMTSSAMTSLNSITSSLPQNPFSQHELFAFQVATMISSSLTLFGAVYTNTCLWLSKPFLVKSRIDEKLLYLMASASIGGSFAFIQNQQVLGSEPLCTIQAIFVQWQVVSLCFSSTKSSSN